MEKSKLLECENDECDRMTVSLFVSANHNAFVCATCVDLDKLTPLSRADALSQRQWEKEQERVAA